MHVQSLHSTVSVCVGVIWPAACRCYGFPSNHIPAVEASYVKINHLVPCWLNKSTCPLFESLLMFHTWLIIADTVEHVYSGNLGVAVL